MFVCVFRGREHSATPKPILDKGLPGCLVSIIILVESQSKIGDLPTWKGRVVTVSNKCVCLNVMVPNDIYGTQS